MLVQEIVFIGIVIFGSSELLREDHTELCLILTVLLLKLMKINVFDNILRAVDQIKAV